MMNLFKSKEKKAAENKAQAMLLVAQAKSQVEQAQATKDKKAINHAKERALVIFNEALVLDSSCAEAYLGRVKCIHFVNADIVRELIRDCTTAIKLKSDYAEAYFLRATWIANLGMWLKSGTGPYHYDYQGAMADHDAAVRLAPTIIEYREKRIYPRLQVKNFSGALEDCNELLRLGASASEEYDTGYVMDAHIGLGDFYSAHKFWSEYWTNSLSNQWASVSEFSKKIWLARMTSAQEGLYAGLKEKERLQKWQEIIRDCDLLLIGKPDYEQVFYCRGFAKCNLKDYAGALTDYSNYIRLNSKNHAGFLSRGCMYYNLGSYKEAAEDYERALALNPGNADSIQFLQAAKQKIAESDRDEQQKATAKQEQERQAERQTAEKTAKQHAENARRQREAEQLQRENEAKNKKEQERHLQQNTFVKKLENLKFESTSGYGDLRALNTGWRDSALEIYAQENQNVDFFVSRGDFYFDAAQKDSNETRKQVLYTNALQDYQQAMTLDPFAPNAAERIEEINAFTHQKASPSIVQPSTMFTGTTAAKVIPMRQDLTPAQLEALEKIKQEARAGLK
jgi:tetratricopeptide (TPR) repeat protein